jgi:excisionase family DNA binding protein
MKAELTIETQGLEQRITERVIKSLAPLLTGRGKDDKALFTVKTLAAYLTVSDQWVYERVHLKEIPFIKMGKFPRFKKSDIYHWLDTLKIPAMKTTSSPLKRII